MFRRLSTWILALRLIALRHWQGLLLLRGLEADVRVAQVSNRCARCVVRCAGFALCGGRDRAICSVREHYNRLCANRSCCMATFRSDWLAHCRQHACSWCRVTECDTS